MWHVYVGGLCRLLVDPNVLKSLCLKAGRALLLPLSAMAFVVFHLKISVIQIYFLKYLLLFILKTGTLLPFISIL